MLTDRVRNEDVVESRAEGLQYVFRGEQSIVLSDQPFNLHEKKQPAVIT
jgi:hypothetical protein